MKKISIAQTGKEKFSKNMYLATDFYKYCLANPEFRFWQALRNWNQLRYPKENFILTAELDDDVETLWTNEKETFYRE